MTQQYNTVEIIRMVNSFKSLADSIRDNVRVIQKVAEGDLTAYVDIRSQGDSLGKNLYHLVQSNDFMFANLLRIADSVAQSAQDISQMPARNWPSAQPTRLLPWKSCPAP